MKQLLLIIPVSLLFACDCLQKVSGTILDKETKQAIDSVYAVKAERDLGVFTDTSGQFKLSAISGGPCGCPPMKVVLSKKGYKKQVIKIPNAKHSVILLVKEK